jgi:hypothetical protein
MGREQLSCGVPQLVRSLSPASVKLRRRFIKPRAQSVSATHLGPSSTGERRVADAGSGFFTVAIAFPFDTVNASAAPSGTMGGNRRVIPPLSRRRHSRGERSNQVKAPTQCALWETPQLISNPNFFEFLENFGEEEHWSRNLLKCRECGQRYIRDYYEEVNFDGGDDWQFANYIPVETTEDIETLKKGSMQEIALSLPRLKEERATAWWIREP